MNLGLASYSTSRELIDRDLNISNRENEIVFSLFSDHLPLCVQSTPWSPIFPYEHPLITGNKRISLSFCTVLGSRDRSN